MNKRLVKFLSLVLIFSFPGVGSAGMVVTDPSSYTYYVEQIKEATKQLETMKSNLETAKSIYSEAKKMRSLLEGTYHHAKGTIQDLKKLREEINDDPKVLLGYAAEFLDKETTEGEEWINPEDILVEVFDDPRRLKDQADRIEELSSKFHIKQKKFEEAIIEAEDVIADMPDNYKHIEEIAAKIDLAESTKEALDINNQLLAEILTAITNLTKLTAHIGEAQAMTNYKGVKSEATKKFQDGVRKSEKMKSEDTYAEKTLKKRGKPISSKGRDLVKDSLDW